MCYFLILMKKQWKNAWKKSSNCIFNADETGILIVLNPLYAVAQKGKKQVDQ